MLLSARPCGVGEDDGSQPESQRIRRIAKMMPADVPDDLFEVGLAICDCNTAANFEAGIDLLLNGLHPEGDRAGTEG